jgi:hypothetical protein
MNTLNRAKRATCVMLNKPKDNSPALKRRAIFDVRRFFRIAGHGEAQSLNL